MTTTLIQFEILSGWWVRRWLRSSIRACQSFPQVGHVCSEPKVEVLPARAFRAARFFSALSNRLASALWAPLVIPARQAERFLANIPTCCHICQSLWQTPSGSLLKIKSTYRVNTRTWKNNVITRTGLKTEELIRQAQDRDSWSRTVRDVAKLRRKDGRKQYKTSLLIGLLPLR